MKFQVEARDVVDKLARTRAAQPGEIGVVHLHRHRHVQPQHRDGPAGGKDAIRCVRVVPDVGFRRRVDVAVDRAGAAHQHHARHTLDDARLQHQRQRNVGERSHRHQRDLTRVLHHHIDDELRRRARVGRGGWFGQINLTQAILAMHEARRLVEGDLQRFCRAVGDGNLRAASKLQQTQRVLGRQLGVDVAKDRRQPHNLQLRRRQRKKNRHRIVNAGVGVKDNLLRHHALHQLMGWEGWDGTRMTRILRIGAD